MTLVTERILHWKPSKDTEYAISLVLDDADFDLGLVDPDTGQPEHYRRILRVEVDSTAQRDSTLTIQAKSLVALPRTLVGPQTNRQIALAVRVTEEGFRWDFTPDHVPVLPGSVSNPSLLTSGGNATASASDVTAAFTPTANSLLVVGWSAAEGTAAPTFTFTNTHAGSGAWSQVTATNPAGTDRNAQARSQVGASPGSGTITNTYTGNQPIRKTWIVAEVTGHDTTTPLSESNTGGADSGTTLSIALGGIAAGNMAIGTMHARNAASITVGTDETELAEATSTGTPFIRTQMEYGTTTTINWSWTDSDENVGVAVEYAQAAVGTVIKDVIGRGRIPVPR